MKHTKFVKHTLHVLCLSGLNMMEGMLGTTHTMQMKWNETEFCLYMSPDSLDNSMKQQIILCLAYFKGSHFNCINVTMKMWLKHNLSMTKYL